MRYYLVIAVLLLALGCARRPATYTVTGTVLLDDKPVAEGDILFVAAAGDLAPNPGRIKDGRYELQATPGKKRVEIRASRIFPGGARGAGGEPVPEECIPTKYNDHSKLDAEVTPDGKNEFNYKLIGGKK